jgi:hypothetical protein
MRNDSTKIIDFYSPINSIEIEFQVNRAVIKHMTLIKKQEKERIEIESALFDEIKNIRFLTTKIIQ